MTALFIIAVVAVSLFIIGNVLLKPESILTYEHSIQPG